MAIAFLIHTCTGTDPLEKQLDPSGPIAYRGRPIQPSVKYIDDKKHTLSGP